MLERIAEEELEDNPKMEISDEETDLPPAPKRGRHGGSLPTPFLRSENCRLICS